MPGQKDKVSVTYRTNRVGAINRSVTITSNAKNSPQIVLRIKGRVLEEGGIKPSQKNGRWGIEDEKGSIIIPFEFDEVKFARNNTFNVRKKGKWGIADKTGVVIIPCEYDEEFDLRVSMYVKKGGKYGIIDDKNKVIIPFEYDEILTYYGSSMPIRKGNKWGLIYDNKVVIPCEYDEEFKYAEKMSVKKGGKWGIIDNKNKVIIPFEYDEKFKVAETMQVKKGGKCGIIDDMNKVFIPFEYDSINNHPINKKVLFAKKNGKWGLIDTKNNAITKFFAEDFGVTTQTKVLFKMPAETNDPKLKAFAGKWGAIAINGKLLLAPVLDETQYFIIMMGQLGQIKSAMDSGSAMDLESAWDKKIEEEMKKWDGKNKEALLQAIQK